MKPSPKLKRINNKREPGESYVTPKIAKKVGDIKKIAADDDGKGKDDQQKDKSNDKHMSKYMFHHLAFIPNLGVYF